MSPARRTQLREIMQMAWCWFRQVGGTFADALRSAWRRHKMASAPAAKIVHLRSPIYSPASRSLAGARYGRSRDFREGGMIASLGR